MKSMGLGGTSPALNDEPTKSTQAFIPAAETK